MPERRLSEDSDKTTPELGHEITIPSNDSNKNQLMSGDRTSLSRSEDQSLSKVEAPSWRSEIRTKVNIPIGVECTSDQGETCESPSRATTENSPDN